MAYITGSNTFTTYLFKDGFIGNDYPFEYNKNLVSGLWLGGGTTGAQCDIRSVYVSCDSYGNVGQMALTNRFVIDFTNYATFYSDFAYKGGSTEGTRSCTMYFSSSKNSIGTQQTGYTNIDISNRTDKYIHLMFYVSHDSFGTWGATQMYLKSKNVITITERDEVSVNINIMDIRNNNKNVDSIELYIDGELYETYNEFKSNIIFSPDVEGNVEVGVIVKYTENGTSGTFATSLTTNLVHHEPVVNIVDNNDMLYISTENETFSIVNKIDVYINSLLSKTYNENFSYNEYTIDKSLYGICENEITVDIFYEQSGVTKKVKRTLVKPYNVTYLLSTDDIVKINERLKILVNTKNIEKKNLIKILNNKNFNLNETNKMIDIIKLVEQLDSTNDNAELLSQISNLTSELNLYYNNLYNVLEEEGVSVTEEDDMASLITKVDEEFEEKENEIEDTKDRLYDLMVEAGYEVNTGMTIDNLLGLLELSGINASAIKQIACGAYHTYILKNDGSLYSCGYNARGQLGMNSSDSNAHSTFTQVTININNDVKQVACGYGHVFIIKNDGSVWSCGNNDYGQLGLGDTTYRTTFTQVTTNINNDVKQIVCGISTAYILKNDGSVWACGRNNYGQLGLGDTNTYKTFTQVTTNVNNDVKQIACGGWYYNSTGYDYSCILKNDGSLWSCGFNGFGELGLGDTTNRNTFTQVTTNVNNDVKEVICGGYSHTFIIKNNGTIWSCGRNSEGHLGLGDSTDRNVFTQVTTNINNDVKQVVCGGGNQSGFTFIMKNDGSLWGCGNNANGQLGLGDTTSRNTFTQVTTNINNDVKQVSCGGLKTIILKNDGSLWSCGANDYGQLGLGDTTDKNVFTKVLRGI